MGGGKKMAGGEKGCGTAELAAGVVECGHEKTGLGEWRGATDYAGEGEM